MAGEKKVSLPINVTVKVTKEKSIGPNHITMVNANHQLIEKIKNCLSTEIELGVVHRKKKDTRNDQYKHIGLKADSFNAQIRNALREIDGIHFETSIENGAFFERNTKSNFDFSFYNRMYNYSKLWNACRTKTDFRTLLDCTIKEYEREEWNVFLEMYSPLQNEDCIVEDDEKTIVGEIQVGNWGLVYKDIFRLLKAKKSPGVNLYIYITATGFLKSKLSDGIVHYNKALKEFKEYMDIIDIPILILGVDIDSPNIEEMEEVHMRVLELESEMEDIVDETQNQEDETSEEEM